MLAPPLTAGGRRRITRYGAEISSLYGSWLSSLDVFNAAARKIGDIGSDVLNHVGLRAHRAWRCSLLR
jgi:hypothetical protein